MRTAKLALVAALVLGLLSLVQVKADSPTAAQSATQPVRSAT